MDDESNAPATKGDIALIMNELRAMGQRFGGLEQRFGGLEQKVDGLEQTVDGLEQKVDGLEQKVDGLTKDLEDFKVEVNTRFQEFEHRMEQNLLDMEGKIITSNYRLADSIQQRLTQTESNQAALIGRLATIEARLTDLERRSNMPPQAQQ